MESSYIVLKKPKLIYLIYKNYQLRVQITLQTLHHVNKL